jgi:hypothetical protein
LPLASHRTGVLNQPGTDNLLADRIAALGDIGSQLWLPSIGQNRSVAPHVTLVHIWIVPSRNVLARIFGVSAKNVVTLDLLGLEVLDCFEMLFMAFSKSNVRTQCAKKEGNHAER